MLELPPSVVELVETTYARCVAGNEDDAWRSIVENFGDRADLDPSETPVPPPPLAPAPMREDPDEFDPPAWDQERFVPPPPPPLPSTTKDRLIAWAGIFGSPTILLVCLVLGISLPRFIALLLVASFVAGFLYLVFLMPRGPRDPGDDGAVL